MARESSAFPTAVDTARRVCERRAERRAEVLEDCLARIEQLQPKLNAFVTVCADDARRASRRDRPARARQEARPARRRAGVGEGHPEHQGRAHRLGLAPHGDNVPDADAVAVARLKDAGAVIVGKTTTPEFAYKLLTDSPLSGITRNPWNAALTPGGSSGGSAVAVAAGMGPLSLATDAGASTRLPAACCGIVGLKPTLGRVPHNQVPDAFNSFIHLGVMARTVATAS